jgi:hypothetical protein
MPSLSRPFHRFPILCTATYQVELLLKLPMAYCLGIGSLITLLVLNSGPAYAEWVLLSKTDEAGMTVFVDPDTIRRKGNLVKIWLLYDYKTAITTGREAVFSTKMQSEYDCAGERVRTNAIFEIAGNMGKGTVVSSSLAEGPWIPIAPETLGKQEWKRACGK